MISEKEYREIRDEAERAKNNHERTKGALRQLKKQLLEEFSCATIAEAKQKLVELTKQEKEAKAELNRRWTKYQQKWMEK